MTTLQRRISTNTATALAVLVIAAMVLFILLPFAMMILTSFKTMQEIFDIPNRTIWTRIIPDRLDGASYRAVITGDSPQLNGVSFLVYIFNSVITTVGIMVPALIMSTMAAHGFSRFSFPGKRVFYYMLLMLLMIPMEMIAIPLYRVVARWGLIDTYIAIILPGAISAFGIFLMTESFAVIPNDYLEAARVDGMKEPAIFLHIMVPMCKGALATFMVIKFTQSWNSFFWPLLVINSETKKTVTVGLTQFTSDLFQIWNDLTAAVVLSLIPTLILFTVARKTIVGSIMRTGLK
ncbi:MAG: carbohydrate ABC transporter permease [Spirochaetales bacterium]|nr:carbohydrate ABC transporter permease [Spirochaetales bacterium]